jgi:hypothetical protein
MNDESFFQMLKFLDPNPEEAEVFFSQYHKPAEATRYLYYLEKLKQYTKNPFYREFILKEYSIKEIEKDIETPFKELTPKQLQRIQECVMATHQGPRAQSLIKIFPKILKQLPKNLQEEWQEDSSLSPLQQAKKMEEFLQDHKESCQKIRVLDFKQLQLTEIHPIIAIFLGLQELDLSRNNIRDIPPQLSNLANLKKLNLTQNQIQDISPELGNLANLKKLNLSQNQIQDISPELGNLANLQELDLSLNHIQVVPPELGNLANLQKLNLSDNWFRDIPPQLGNLVNLQELNLSDNRIRDISPELGNLTNLQKLVLDPVLDDHEIRTLFRGLREINGLIFR